MIYIATVVLVFETGRTGLDKFDLWEIQTAVEADDPKKALFSALSLSKDPNDWRRLGYSCGPILSAVRLLHKEADLLWASEEEHHMGRLPALVGTINEQQLQSLRSFDEIYLPYSVMHIDESS